MGALALNTRGTRVPHHQHSLSPWCLKSHGLSQLGTSGVPLVSLPQVLDLHDNQLTALPDDTGQLTALQVWLQETQPTSDPLNEKLKPHRPRMFWSCSGPGCPGRCRLLRLYY